MEEITYKLATIDNDSNFILNFETNVNSDPVDKLHRFTVRVKSIQPFSSYAVLILDYLVHEESDSNCEITDFMLPLEMRGYRVGGFILNRIYKMMPSEVKKRARVWGILAHKDQSAARDMLFKKLINFPGSKDSSFKPSNENQYGKFSGRFFDVGESWKKSLILKT